MKFGVCKWRVLEWERARGLDQTISLTLLKSQSPSCDHVLHQSETWLRVRSNSGGDQELRCTQYEEFRSVKLVSSGPGGVLLFYEGGNTKKHAAMDQGTQGQGRAPGRRAKPLRRSEWPVSRKLSRFARPSARIGEQRQQRGGGRWSLAEEASTACV